MFVLSVLGIRIACEMTAVIFRIAENTTRLVQQSEATTAKSSPEEE